MKVEIRVADDAAVRRSLDELGNSAGPALVTSINRVVRDLRSRVLTKTTEVYNISRRDLSPFVQTKLASGNSIEGRVRLLIRAIPIEFFRPRIRMQTFTFQWRGRTVTRKLPAVYLRRLRGGEEKYVSPAFPLHQRRSGVVARGEPIRRRTGSSSNNRNKLTKLRYYTFPKQFVEEVLLPDAQEFIGPAINVELGRAFRRPDRHGVDRLRRNR